MRSLCKVRHKHVLCLDGEASRSGDYAKDKKGNRHPDTVFQELDLTCRLCEVDCMGSKNNVTLSGCLTTLGGAPGEQGPAASSRASFRASRSFVPTRSISPRQTIVLRGPVVEYWLWFCMSCLRNLQN